MGRTRSWGRRARCRRSVTARTRWVLDSHLGRAVTTSVSYVAGIGLCTSTGTLKKKTHAHNAESWKLAVLASWKLQRAHGRQRVVFARCGRGTICSLRLLG